MSVPATPVPVKVVADAPFSLIGPLVSVQVPVLAVVHDALPPAEKLPETVALAMFAPVFTSRTVTAADARQLPPERAELPDMDLNATVCDAGWGAGALPASENSSRFGEPGPITEEISRLGVAFVTSQDATAAGVAPGLAASTRAATPATCGDAIDVPPMVLVAVE